MKYSATELLVLERLNAPELDERAEPENAFLWQAYHHMRSSRQPDGAIPFSAVTDYCAWAGITCPVQKNRLARVVITLDNAERAIHGRSAPKH